MPLPNIRFYFVGIMMEEKQQDQLQPWHRKALISGRNPLPETPGARPWLPSIKQGTEEQKQEREQLERKVFSLPLRIKNTAS
jgi:alkylated DNA nucleotide flippase Atl1